MKTNNYHSLHSHIQSLTDIKILSHRSVCTVPDGVHPATETGTTHLHGNWPRTCDNQGVRNCILLHKVL